MNDTPSPIEIPLVGQMDLWHPAGVKVRLPVVLTTWKDSLDSVTAALEAGWLVNAPGLEEGETKDEVGYVVHRSIENARDGTTTDIIDLYSPHDGMKFAFLTVYLNTKTEVEQFEQVSGMRVDSIPLYVGDNKIERGKKRETDKFVVKVPRQFSVAHKPNPKYDAEEAKRCAAAQKGYMVAKRKFTRWAGLPAAAPAASEQPTGELVSQEQASQLLSMLTLAGGTLVQFAHEFKCHPGQLPVNRFAEARDRLKAACERKMQAAAAG